MSRVEEACAHSAVARAAPSHIAHAASRGASPFFSDLLFFGGLRDLSDSAARTPSGTLSVEEEEDIVRR